MNRDGRILLAHGAGGRLTHELVSRVCVPAFDNRHLRELSDAAVLDELPIGRPAITTDGFVVDPPVFPGGDLGYLSVCGTVNDLAVSGARPLYLTWALILEEGCENGLFETIVAGASRAAREAGVQLVAGDTKVVPRGKGDRVYAVTSGIGVVPLGRELGDRHVRAGDKIVASGTLGDHGATIMACRHGAAGPELRSDCRPLGGLVETALGSGAQVRCMHDPTRGGLATLCNEVAGRSKLRMRLDESSIPVRGEAAAVCELLGLDPLYLACEGRAIFWVAADDSERLVSALRAHELGRDACVIGQVEALGRGEAPVVLETRIGGRRPIDMLSGSDLPRIC